MRSAGREVKDNPRPDPPKQPNYEKLKAATPTFLGGEQPKLPADVLYRPVFAEWVTSAKNPYFARAMANRMWAHFFGRGIVNPVDDMHDGNPPSHPELLQTLADQFVINGFDHKYLCRAICYSQAYQRTSKPPQLLALEAEEAGARGNPQLFSRMAIKVLSPAQLYDSLVVVSGSSTGSAGTRAFGVPRPPAGKNWRSEFIDFFRIDGEPNPTSYDRGIPQLLRLMNSPQFHSKQKEVPGLGTAGKSPAQVVEELYLRVLARRPTAPEARLMSTYITQNSASPQTYNDIFWALLTSSEFSLNH